MIIIQDISTLTRVKVWYYNDTSELCVRNFTEYEDLSEWIKQQDAKFMWEVNE